MKKILFLTFTLLLLNTLKAQNGFETQVSLGLPSNTLSKETSSFNAALNLGYMFSTKKEDSEIENSPLNSPTSWQYGVSVGYSYTIRDKTYDNLQLLPISAVVRMYYLGFFSLGMAAGYDVDLKSNPENSRMFGEATLGIGVPQGSLFFAVKGNIFDKNTPLSSIMSIGLRLLLVKQK